MALPAPALLVAQIAAILVSARLAGRLAGAAGQPRVVGEMAAGIALGPSALGAIAPGMTAALFPASGLRPLELLSRVGITLFMFVVGLRLDLGLLRGQTRAAVMTSHASIVAPFALGLLLAPRLHASLAGPGVPPRTFALFVAAAMSVTAFPVLARILTERGLLGTRVGTIALASAAVDDVTAWSVLAGVVAAARAGAALGPAARAVSGAAAFGALVLFVGRPVLRRAFAGPADGATPSATAARSAAAVLVALACAAATEWIGVHALFGAFLAGTAMPRARGFATGVAGRLEGPVATLLVPLFFAFTGLRTTIGLVTEGGLWGTCLLVLACAVVGKAGASALAARLTGSGWREALAIGALMNTRGLMELVILNIGLDAGVISAPLFAIMVVMALVTTLMTSPLLALAGVASPRVALP